MRWDSLDRASLLSIGLLLLIAAVVIARGDQVGLAVVQVKPAHQAANVSVRGSVQVVFNEAPLLSSLEAQWRVEPPVSGTLHVNATLAQWTPMVALEANTIYTVTINTGVLSQRGRALLHPVQWSFRTRAPQVVYLSPAGGIPNLVSINPDDLSSPPRQLTDEPFGVYDFAISPDGRHIAYSVNRAEFDSERDLWLINHDGSERRLLVRCDNHVCQSPTWSSDGTIIAFQKQPLIAGTLGRSPGPGRIWLFYLDQQQAAPLFEDSQRIGSLPRFAPRAPVLAFYDGLRNVIQVVNLADGSTRELPSAMGDTGSWSPDSTQLVYPDLLASDAGEFSHLLRADLANNVITPLTKLGAYNAVGAVWSPVGTWVAFGRQDYRSGTRGAQVWLAAVEDDLLVPLTNDSGFNYGSLAWSPDGGRLVAQRFDLVTPNAKPEIWLLAADGRSQRLLATDAMLPAWLP